MALFESGEGMIGDVEENEWVKVVCSTRVRKLGLEAVPTLKQLCRTNFPLAGLAEANLYHAPALESEEQIEGERQFLQQLLGDLRHAFEKALDGRRGFLISHG